MSHQNRNKNEVYALPKLTNTVEEVFFIKMNQPVSKLTL